MCQVDGLACNSCRGYGYCRCSCQTFQTSDVVATTSAFVSIPSYESEVDPDDVINHLCGILDLEMFSHGSFHRVREIGFISMNSSDAVNLQVHPGHLPLDDSDVRRTLYYVRNKVHGLAFHPKRGHMVLQQKSVPVMINALYQCSRTPTKTVVAYKGGHHERQLLTFLNIPHFNLENLGDCPSYQYSEVLYPNCGWHVHAPQGYLHCASSEVKFYQQWLLS